MKIYTKTGDDGTTGLVGGRRVGKADPRIECYGTVDELNAAIGLAEVASADEGVRTKLRAIQNELFVIGSHLATPTDSPHKASLPTLNESAVARLEAEIDAAQAELPALRQFILPGGTEAAARLHFARTVCRRAERRLVEMAAREPVEPLTPKYVNRLSDWLFVFARHANHAAGVPDIPWQKP